MGEVTKAIGEENTDRAVHRGPRFVADIIIVAEIDHEGVINAET
jgi:hypothetical protein